MILDDAIHVVREGADLYVEQVGPADAPPVVFLHGGPGASAHAFREFLGDDLESYRMVYADQRGGGRSYADAPFDLDTLADDVAALSHGRSTSAPRRCSRTGSEPPSPSARRGAIPTSSAGRSGSTPGCRCRSWPHPAAPRRRAQPPSGRGAAARVRARRSRATSTPRRSSTGVRVGRRQAALRRPPLPRPGRPPPPGARGVHRAARAERERLPRGAVADRRPRRPRGPAPCRSPCSSPPATAAATPTRPRRLSRLPHALTALLEGATTPTSTIPSPSSTTLRAALAHAGADT
jgi:hypothetical protein